MDQNQLYSLTVFENQDHIDSSTKFKEDWRKKSLDILDSFEVQNQFGNGDLSNCIFFNEVQGKNINVGIENSLETHRVILFLICSQTYKLGKIVKENF